MSLRTEIEWESLRWRISGSAKTFMCRGFRPAPPTFRKLFRPSDMTNRWRRCLLSFLIAMLTSSAGTQTAVSRSNDGAWVLAWSDEFNGPNGSPVDPSKWIVETGGGGWGNHELEYYTSRPQNVSQ